jgi:hypothetical protein
MNMPAWAWSGMMEVCGRGIVFPFQFIEFFGQYYST